MDISTDKGWFSSFPPEALAEESFVYPVFQAAFQDQEKLDAEAYGRWTREAYVLKGDDRSAIAYTIPLILSDGTVYGVLGVEMLTSYMQSLLPNKELENQGYGSYHLASTEDLLSGETIDFREEVCSSSLGSVQKFSSSNLILTEEEGEYWLQDPAGKSYAAIRPLTLYSRNAPFFHEKWVLVGTVENKYLFAFSNHTIFLMCMALLLILVFGLISSLAISHYLSAPIARLSGEVTAAQKDPTAMPEFSNTRIRELDHFATAVTQLSQDVINTSTKFLRIMEMASVDLGGYEIRSDSSKVYVTKNFFSILGMPEKREENLSREHFQEILRDFCSNCPSSKG